MTDATGLRAPTMMGLDSKSQEDIHREWDTMTGVENLLVKYGVAPQPQPTYACPEVTEDELTTTENQEYTQTYARLLGWFNYLAPLLAEVKAAELQVENEMEYVSAKLRKDIRTHNAGKKARDPDRYTEGNIKDEIILDENYHELHVEQQRLSQMQLMLKARTDSVERSLRVVSRQVEIRRLDIEQGRTEGNMPGRNKWSPTTRPNFRQPGDQND
jgi:hypothetical protein